VCNFCNRFHTFALATFVYKPTRSYANESVQNIIAFFYTFPFYFSLPFLFSILPVLQCFFFWYPCLVCPLPYSSFPLTTPQNLAAPDIITSYHSLLLCSTKLLFNVLISMSQDKPEVIYCCHAHGPVVFHLTLKGTLLFKLLEISLCNL